MIAQLRLDECSWNVVNQQIQISSVKRYPWKTIFGMSLTAFITELKSLYGLDSEQVFNHIVGVLQKNNLDNVRVRELVYKSVHSRFAEQSALKKRLEKQGGN